jgi:hypothetical protein
MMHDRRMYTTAVPHLEGEQSYHINWIEFAPWSWNHSCTCLQRGHACHYGMCQCLDLNIKCSSACHREDAEAYNGRCLGCLRSDLQVGKPTDYHLCSNMVHGEAHRYVPGEMFQPMSRDQIPSSSDLGVPFDRTRPKKSRQQSLHGEISVSHPYGIIGRPHTTHQGRALCNCFYSKHHRMGPAFVMIAGSLDQAALLIRTDSGVRARQGRIESARKLAQTEPLHTIEQVTQAIRTGYLPSTSLVDYFISLQLDNHIILPTFRKGLVVKSFNVKSYFQSLRALSLATKTYKDLPGSTISLGIISLSLHDALWLPPPGVQQLSRQEKFACIAMFESGTYNIEPTALDDVIAISSRNSIFASKLLHHDPSSVEHRDDIT